MKVKYCGPAKDYSGYGEANRHDIAALIEAGIDVTTQLPMYVMEISDFGKLGNVAIQAENLPYAYIIKILHTTPNVYKQFMEPGKYHIGRIFWETDKLPLDFATNAELMDEIWTGSQYNADSIRKSGVTKPIYIIPEAIDTELPVGILPYEELPVDGTFRFYSIFEWTERKNPTALLQAFWQEFEGQDDVSLTLKTYVDNFTPDKRSEVNNNIRKIKYEMGLGHYAPVYTYKELMDRHQIYRFHKSFDCFVSAHRGEGWGVPQMEAMLMGNPIISTNCGGIHEYLKTGDNALLIPYSSVKIGENSRNKQWYTPDQNWAEVDIKELRSAMRWCYENRAQAKELGLKGKAFVEENFSLRAVGEKMKDRLRDIVNAPSDTELGERILNAINT